MPACKGQNPKVLYGGTTRAFIPTKTVTPAIFFKYYFVKYFCGYNNNNKNKRQLPLMKALPLDDYHCKCSKDYELRSCMHGPLLEKIGIFLADWCWCESLWNIIHRQCRGINLVLGWYSVAEFWHSRRLAVRLATIHNPHPTKVSKHNPDT